MAQEHQNTLVLVLILTLILLLMMVLSVASVRRGLKQKKIGKAKVSTALLVKLVFTVMSSIHLIFFIDQTLVIFPFMFNGREHHSPIYNNGDLKCQTNDMYMLENCSLCKGNKTRVDLKIFRLLS